MHVLGDVPWHQPPDTLQEGLSMPEFILFCLQTSELSSLAKRKKTNKHCMSFSLGLHIKILSVLYRQQYGGFLASNAFLSLLLLQMERFCKQKQYTEGMCESASRHFRLQIFVLLLAVGKSVIEEHNYRFIRNAGRASFPVSLTLFCLQSKLSANT